MSTTDDDAIAAARPVVAAAARELSERGARDEALAEYVPERRVLGVRRAPVLRPLGRVWRLGVLLLDRNGVLRATGRTTRVLEPGRPGYQSRSAEERREYRAAAVRGRFRDGEVVDFDAPVIELDAAALRASDGPLLLRDGALLVRWSAAAGDAGAVPFERYVRERVELLVHPPEGA